MKKLRMRIKKSKVYQLYRKVLDFNTSYSIFSISAEASFYMIISAISLLVLSIQIMNYSSNLLTTSLVKDMLDLFNESLKPLIIQMIPKFTLSSISVIVVFNILWSSSAILNRYNKIADIVYSKVAPRGYIENRINSIMMFSMLLLIVLFAVVIVSTLRFVLIYKIGVSNDLVVAMFDYLADYFALLVVLLIIYINAPPIKVSVKKAIFGAMLSSILILGEIKLFIAAAGMYYQVNPYATITFVISTSLIFLFAINYTLILGLIVNYKINGNN